MVSLIVRELKGSWMRAIPQPPSRLGRAWAAFSLIVGLGGVVGCGESKLEPLSLIETARATLPSVEPRENAILATSELAAACILVGRGDLADSLWESLEGQESPSLDLARQQRAELVAQQGDAVRAIELLDTIDSPAVRDEARRSLIQILVDRGKLAQSLELARSFEKPEDRVAALYLAARAQHRFHRRASVAPTMAEARKVLDTLTDARQMLTSLGDLAVTARTVGERQRMFDTILEMEGVLAANPDLQEDPRARLEYARLLARAGDAPRAIKMAQEIPSGEIDPKTGKDIREEAFAAIFPYITRLAKLDTAEELLEEIQDPAFRIRATIQVGEGLTRAANATKSQALLSQVAIEFRGLIERQDPRISRIERDELLRLLALAQIEAGDESGARLTADLLADAPGMQGEVLLACVRRQLQLERLEQAVALSERLEFERSRAEAARFIARYYAEKGDDKRGSRFAKYEPIPLVRVMAYVGLIEGIAARQTSKSK